MSSTDTPGPSRPTRRGKWREHVPLIERAAKVLTLSERREEDEAPRAPQISEPARVRDRDQVAQGLRTTRRTSRLAEVDVARLKKAGLLTPGAARSRTKEEFRVIKRSVLRHAFQPNGDGAKASNLVMVSSAKPGEGKTFTAINLAISIALERDYTVLLIDADFTKPAILKTLGIEATKGLVDVLEDPGIDLADVLIRTSIDKLTVLPAGHSHSLGTELLASQRMKDIVHEIARRYRDRLVIFDSPPILSTSEPCALAMHVGQIVFVVEAEKTPRSAVQEALDLIGPGPRIGLVLNRCQPQLGHAQFGSYYKR